MDAGVHFLGAHREGAPRVVRALEVGRVQKGNPKERVPPLEAEEAAQELAGSCRARGFAPEHTVFHVVAAEDEPADLVLEAREEAQALRGRPRRPP